VLPKVPGTDSHFQWVAVKGRRGESESGDVTSWREPFGLSAGTFVAVVMADRRDTFSG
jgi:hypothetical protein